ncbi:MAG: hypothetical protein KQH63_17375 [Desulfobulbaceae bacterium]|nr:hypothetical protein [Desulfobulbaceae bacterium]
MSCSGPSGPIVQRYAPLEQERLCKVALLPFVNNTRFNQGNTIVQRIFGSELARIAGVEVVREGDVRKVYPQLRIYPNQVPDVDQIRILGSRLGVDYLILGTVSAMEENFSEQHVNPLLALNLEVHEAQSGRVMWTTYHKKEGRDYRTIMHFGLVNTVTELCRVMSQEILDMWFSEGLKKCGE